MAEAATVNSLSHEEDLDDVSCNMRIYMIYYMLLNRTRFKVVVIMNVHNRRLIPMQPLFSAA